MTAPLFSTITLITELGVTGAILLVFFYGIRHGKFRSALAFGTLAYEIIFNISYMVYRSMQHEETQKKTIDLTIAIAIAHGVLSLIMFFSLILFFLFAYRGYSKGENFFKEKITLSIIFLIFWGISIGSGITLYIREYVH